MNTLAYAGYIVALIGGALLILFGFLGLVNIVLVPFSPLFYLGRATHGLLILIIGIIGVIGARHVGRLGWAIALLILGIIAGGIGGTLLFIGGLLGLLSALVKL